MPKQCMINGNKPPTWYSSQGAAIGNHVMERSLKFKNCETWLPATNNNGSKSNISLSSCLYWHTPLKFCKYLKSRTHLRNAQANKASSVNKGIVKISLFVHMVRKIGREFLFLVVYAVTLFWLVLVYFESFRILVHPKDLNICFSRLWKFIPWQI